MKPEIRFKDFSGPEALEWEQRKFGELVRRISGAALSSPEKPGVEYEDINSGEGTLNKDIRLKVGAKKGQPFEPADLLYGKLRPYLKNILLPDFSGVAIGDFWVLRPARYSSTFLFNLIQTPRFEEKANCSAGSKMPRADWKLVSNSIFAVPKDPREAEKIGELFLSLNSTITLHQKKLEHFKRLKKSLLQNMFPREGKTFPRLRFPEFTDAWEQRKLKDLTSINSGRDYKHLGTGEIPVYGTGGHMLSVDQALSETEDAVGIGRKGTIDKPFLLKAPFWTVDTLFYAVPKKNESNLNFLFCLFQKVNWKAKDESTGVPSLAKKTIEATDVVIPTLPEQKKIGELFQQLDSTLTLHQRQLTSLEQIKCSLLAKMFV